MSGLVATLGGCSDADDETLGDRTEDSPPGGAADAGEGVDESVTFEVTLENVSEPGAMRTSDDASIDVVFAPAAYVVDGGEYRLFELDAPAAPELERLAEDGQLEPLLQRAAAFETVRESGRAGADELGVSYGESPLGPGVAVRFRFEASPGDRLALAFMFIQSNDTFVATPAQGLELFVEGAPWSGEVTASLGYFDAGTERDEPYGVGPAQAPRQPEADFGDAEGGLVRHLGDPPAVGLPPLADVLRVSVAPVTVD